MRVCSEDLKSYLEGMIDAVFGPVQKRWIDACAGVLVCVRCVCSVCELAFVCGVCV